MLTAERQGLLVVLTLEQLQRNKDDTRQQLHPPLLEAQFHMGAQIPGRLGALVSAFSPPSAPYPKQGENSSYILLTRNYLGPKEIKRSRTWRLSLKIKTGRWSGALRTQPRLELTCQEAPEPPTTAKAFLPIPGRQPSQAI